VKEGGIGTRGCDDHGWGVCVCCLLRTAKGLVAWCRPENACRDAPLGAATSVGTGGGDPRFLGGQNSINPFSPILKPTQKLKHTLGGGFGGAKFRTNAKNKNVQGSDTLVVYSFF